ncbi:MAG: cyclic nucleotide-binding domain-containing protein, partial [Clostridia bacterium]|nr:cyclic nucleotide-binding domain-containing protein [Clostridia bacterium]
MSKTPITRYRAGHVILRQGESKDCLFKILSGTVALYVHYGEAEEYLMGSLTAPHFFGETTILSGQPSSYTAVAHSDVLA